MSTAAVLCALWSHRNSCRVLGLCSVRTSIHAQTITSSIHELNFTLCFNRELARWSQMLPDICVQSVDIQKELALVLHVEKGASETVNWMILASWVDLWALLIKTQASLCFRAKKKRKKKEMAADTSGFLPPSLCVCVCVSVYPCEHTARWRGCLCEERTCSHSEYPFICFSLPPPSSLKLKAVWDAFHFISQAG